MKDSGNDYVWSRFRNGNESPEDLINLMKSAKTEEAKLAMFPVILASFSEKRGVAKFNLESTFRVNDFERVLSNNIIGFYYKGAFTDGSKIDELKDNQHYEYLSADEDWNKFLNLFAKSEKEIYIILYDRYKLEWYKSNRKEKIILAGIMILLLFGGIAFFELGLEIFGLVIGLLGLLIFVFWFGPNRTPSTEEMREIMVKQANADDEVTRLRRLRKRNR
jgi:hypothetical protein